jgi:exodeoxyribonuclease V alpha subunit
MSGIKAKIRITREVFHRDDFYILSAVLTETNREIKLNQYGGISLTGNLGYLNVDNTYEVVLKEGKVSKYGLSYEVVDVPSLAKQELNKLSDEEKYTIMRSATSSDRIATNILKSYPNFIDDVVMKSDEELEQIIDLKRIKGVGKSYFDAYKRILREKFRYFGFIHRDELKKYDLSIDDAKAIFKRWSNPIESVAEVEKNPYYVLTEVCGRSFDKVDNLLKTVREDLIDSDERCEAVVLDILHRNEEDASSRLNGNLCYKIMRDDYNCGDLKKRIVNVCKNGSRIYYDEKTKDLSIFETYMKEVNIASYARTANINCEVLNLDVEKYRVLSNGIKLTDEQLKAVENFKNYRFSILAGKSGSGKSSSARAITDACRDLGLSITQLSPTATAAKRLSETTGIYASTVHLKCLRDREISTDVLLIDESSMLGLDVFTMFMNCITNDKIRIVLIGDPFQLASISLGTVFADFINSNVVPKVELSQVFRYNDSGIAYAGENARQGKDFFNDKEVKHIGNKYTIMGDWNFIEMNDDEEITDEVVEQYTKLVKSGIKQDEILVLSAYNVGSCGSYILNSKIQENFNPPKVGEKIFERKVSGFGKITFRKGDRVINKKNNYKQLTYDGWKEIQDSNGVLSVDEVETTPIFNGQRGVVIDILDSVMVVKFDEQLVVYDKLTIYNLLLGFAISTFSAQGQEAPYVINVVSETQTRLMSKNLLYVADTRSKKKQIDIGSVKAYKDALLVDNVSERNTWLLDLLTA